MGRRYGTEKGRPLGGKREESREKTEERREKMAASLIHCIFTVSRDHFEKVMKISRGHRNGRQLDSLHFYSVPWPLDEGPKNTNELPRVCFPKALKIRGGHQDGCQLDSLHFYSVP